MPLREDLLQPIAGENPSGPNLYYDKVFDQIKEARREDEEPLPGDDWAPAQLKKADFRQVVKLAGDTLAAKSKDLRLAGFLIEAQMRLEGLPILVPGIDLVLGIQEQFWDTFHPVIEDGDIEGRSFAVEAVVRQAALAAEVLALTKNGLSLRDYKESRHVGYEKDATSSSKREAREDAIQHGKLTAEDFDLAFAATPKAFYVEAEAAFDQALESEARLDEFHQDKYGEFAPNMAKLRSTLEEVRGVAASLLSEKRKTESDPVAAPEQAAAGPAGEGSAEPAMASSSGFSGQTLQVGELGEAYQMVVSGATYFVNTSPSSPVAYLVCSGLRLGETRMQGPEPAPGFAVGPTPEMRQTMRALAQRGAWVELLRAAIPILASPCSRAWLDLHRYIWRAGQETGAEAITAAVEGTLRGLLEVRPEVRYWTLEDDTGAANHETQQWLDSAVLRSS